MPQILQLTEIWNTEGSSHIALFGLENVELGVLKLRAFGGKPKYPNEVTFIRKREPEKKAVKIVAGGKVLEVEEDP